MKVTIIETKEGSGDWIKVYIDDMIHACIGYGYPMSKTRDEAIARANEIALFCYENGGDKKIIKELETKEE